MCATVKIVRSKTCECFLARLCITRGDQWSFSSTFFSTTTAIASRLGCIQNSSMVLSIDITIWLKHEHTHTTHTFSFLVWLDTTDWSSGVDLSFPFTLRFFYFVTTHKKTVPTHSREDIHKKKTAE